MRIGTSDTRRGLRARDLNRFVPEFSSTMNNAFMMDVGGLTGGRTSAASIPIAYLAPPSALAWA